jgi:hypothetical protein
MSARSPAMMAPKKVPQERIETMSEVCEAETTSAPGNSTASLKIWEPRTPLM